LLATGPLTPAETRKAIREIRDLTDKPFGANTTLMMPGAAENAKVLLEEKVPVINIALGKGDWIAKKAHMYGGKVIATVVSTTHALKAEGYGADAIQATGHEAAAHGEFLTSLVMIPRFAEVLKIPVIAAGGFADGRGLMAALALGAGGVSMGTRFMNTQESPLSEIYKKLSVDKDMQDTVYTNKFDGLYCRVLDTPAAKKAIKTGLSYPTAFVNAQKLSKQIGVPFLKLALGIAASGWKNLKQMAFLACALEKVERATVSGDTDVGVLPIGQVTGLIHDQPTVAELMERIIKEAVEIQKKLNAVVES
jgi:enoyl-[acyl-carrier protein] reductase II